jgi:hypothetical protein
MKVTIDPKHNTGRMQNIIHQVVWYVARRPDIELNILERKAGHVKTATN